jgi:hypothetical protein
VIRITERNTGNVHQLERPFLREVSYPNDQGRIVRTQIRDKRGNNYQIYY